MSGIMNIAHIGLGTVGSTADDVYDVATGNKGSIFSFNGMLSMLSATIFGGMGSNDSAGANMGEMIHAFVVKPMLIVTMGVNPLTMLGMAAYESATAIKEFAIDGDKLEGGFAMFAALTALIPGGSMVGQLTKESVKKEAEAVIKMSAYKDLAKTDLGKNAIKTLKNQELKDPRGWKTLDNILANPKAVPELKGDIFKLNSQYKTFLTKRYEKFDELVEYYQKSPSFSMYLKEANKNLTKATKSFKASAGTADDIGQALKTAA